MVNINVSLLLISFSLLPLWAVKCSNDYGLPYVLHIEKPGEQERDRV